MNLCLSQYFKEMFLMKFFWNSQKKWDLPRAMQELKISNRISVTMTQNITKRHLKNEAGLRCANSTPNATAYNVK